MQDFALNSCTLLVGRLPERWKEDGDKKDGIKIVL